MNQSTGYKIIIMSQSYKVITPCKAANTILATIIEMKRNNIQIKVSNESINELDIV